jgi:hypothetical protein
MLVLTVRRFPGVGVADSRSLRSLTISECDTLFVGLRMFLFASFLGDVRREFMQCSI